jgi:hypothetical protein
VPGRSTKHGGQPNRIATTAFVLIGVSTSRVGRINPPEMFGAVFVFGPAGAAARTVPAA